MAPSKNVPAKTQAPEQECALQGFWESPDRHPGKLLSKIPVIKADINHYLVVGISHRLITDEGARATMEEFLGEAPETWHCVNSLLDAGGWEHDDVANEKCKHHAGKYCVVVQVSQYKWEDESRSGLILRRLGCNV